MLSTIFQNTPLGFFASSFWRDEAFSYLMAKQPLFQLIWLTAKDSNPPLYYLILKMWMLIFGPGEIALRSLSFICFWLMLFFIYLILTESFHINWKKAYIYLLFVISNPILHYYAFEARMYSLVGLISTMSFYYLFTKKYIYYAIVVIVGLYTHYLLITLFGVQIAISLVTLNAVEKKLLISEVKNKIPFFFLWIVIILFAKPPISNGFWIQKPFMNDFFLFPSYIYTGYEKMLGIQYNKLLILSIMLFFLFFVALFYTYKKQRSTLARMHLFILLSCSYGISFLFLLISFIKPIFLPRYLIFSTVSLLLFIIYIVNQSSSRFFYLVLIFFFIINVQYGKLQTKKRKKAPLRYVFASIQIEIQKNDVVFVTHEHLFHPAQYYLRNTSNKVFIYGKSYEELPWYVGKVLISPNDIATHIPYYPQRAFIVNNDGTYRIQFYR